MIYGREVGAGGTPHVQGYLELSSRKTLNSLKSFLLSTGITISPHLEVRRGSAAQASEYCRKENEWLEFGTISEDHSGRRTDLEQIRADIVDGVSEREIAESHFAQWVRYRAAFREYRSMLLEVREPEYALDSFAWNVVPDWSRSIILHGASGIGKTEYAKALLGEGYLLVSHMDELSRFDETVHSGIIFDDMDFKHFPRTAQIHLMDQGEARALHIRYGIAVIPAHTKKVFTTNESSGQIVLLEDPAIRRRVQVHHLMISE